MPLTELLIASRDRLRTDLPLLQKSIHVTPPPGRPHPRAGQEFIALFGSAWTPHPDSNNQNHMGLDEEFSVSITLSRRTSTHPDDSLDDAVYLDEVSSMENRVREIMASIISGRFDIMAASDVEALEPLFWIGNTGPEECFSDWWQPRNPAGKVERKFEGYRWTVNFRGSRRISDLRL